MYQDLEEMKDSINVREMIRASRLGDVDKINDLTAGNINTADNEGDVALIEATKNGHLPVIELLLKRGADVNITSYGATPLFFAKDVEIAKVLIQAGANIETEGWEGWCPLFEIVYRGYDEVVNLLIENGVNVNRKLGEDNEDFVKGATALIIAAQQGHTECVRLLCDKVDNIDHTDRKGWSALMHASYEGHEEVVKVLISRGADINKVDLEGKSSLWLATAYHHDVVKVLLEHNADYNITDNTGCSPLMRAQKRNNAFSINLLKEMI
jgi:ankyrin repeat protein